MNNDAKILTLKDLGKMKDDFALQRVTTEAPGAWPNGSRVVKCNAAADDGHPNGAQGTVTGSMGPAEMGGRQVYGYFVSWDDMPGVPVFVASYTEHRVQRLKLVSEVVKDIETTIKKHVKGFDGLEFEE